MSTQPQTPDDARLELTLRGVILGVVITLLFTAANVFFGLRAGLTFATSIPAAVLSMAMLRWFGNSTLQENNIVQTIASAAGTLSAIIFVLPGLVMVGWWTGFPYWTSFAICALGGILGVMYSIPLRRALVTNSDLPYPEGVACAEVLKVGSATDPEVAKHSVEAGRAGLLAVIWGSIASAAFALVVATGTFAGAVSAYFRTGKGATGFDFGLLFGLLAVGHLVGLWVGIAMGVGQLITWGYAVPYYSGLAAVLPDADAQAIAIEAWRTKVRFIGAGTIGIAAVWTLIKLVGPVVGGLRSALAAQRARSGGQGALPRTEQDIPIAQVGLVTLLCLAPIAWLLWDFGAAGGLQAKLPMLVFGGLAYIVLMSFFVSAVCGYMAGLIGSSNSPLSGVGILVVIVAALLIAYAVQPALGAGAGPALVAFALFVTSVVFAVATIANNNLQDLKTGQLVDATPWRQQVALVIGVIAGAAVIPPVIDLAQEAYGFAGMPGVDPTNALAAPQAALISTLAQGVIEGNIDWELIKLGMKLGVALILIDEGLKRFAKPASLPPLAVGLGIYLPTFAVLMVVVGAVVGHLYDRAAGKRSKPEAVKQLGVLLASGLIVGEGLMGVIVAALVVAAQQGYAPSLVLVGPEFATWAAVLGGLAFAGLAVFLYRWVSRLVPP
jgi:putative OPT family oligopeptide transporter